jgi:hypothetical protein
VIRKHLLRRVYSGAYQGLDAFLAARLSGKHLRIRAWDDVSEFGRRPGLQLFIKTTVVGGFVFLMPAVIVVGALGELIGALKVLDKAVALLF